MSQLGTETENSKHVDELVAMSLRQRRIRIDRMFTVLLVVQWVAGIIAALVVSPYAWAGKERVVLDSISGVRVEGNGPRVVLGLQHGNEPALQLIDKDGWTRATLTLTNTNTAPILKFLDPRGDTRMWLGAMSDGKAQLYMMSRPERGAGVRPSWAALEVAADGTLGLRLNQAGTVWRAP